MFFHHEINPFNVTDIVTFRNLEKSLTLTVKADASVLVINLKHAYDRLASQNDDTDEKEKAAAALDLASTIFGQEQGERLCRFYEDPLYVITACGKYLRDRLTKKITKAQKKL